jgi:hypothetical protein
MRTSEMVTKQHVCTVDDNPEFHVYLLYPRPASLARMIAWARSATCSLVKMLET